MADEMTTSSAAPAVATEEKKTTVKSPSSRTTKKKKVVKTVSTGRVYVSATYNNTIVTVTDTNGNVLGWSSAGACGFKGPKKATPYAAGIIVKNVMEKLQDVGLKEVVAFVTGVGSGREGAVRALHAAGLHVATVKDVTPIPHNGCRAPKPRRV